MENNKNFPQFEVEIVFINEKAHFVPSMTSDTIFPYKDEQEYKNHDFYKIIEEVNISGIPFLPSTTGLIL